MVFRSKANLLLRYFVTSLSPKLSVSLLYRIYHRKKLNLKEPQTLDEKIQWMKLNYYKDNELVKQCADKYRVRDYVESCGLGHILNPLLHTFHHASEIDWSILPQKFVLKWNFGCGGNVICDDKEKLDIPSTIRDLDKFEKIKFHLIAAEPQYNFDEKLILCEQFIETEDGLSPVDYKFYCFNGEAKYVLCCIGRGTKEKPDFYFFNRQWQLQRLNHQGQAAPEGFTIPKPDGMDQLFEYAEVLSKPFPFVRADFYLEKGKAYFGELTFTPAGGFDKGRLPETDLLFGQMVQLPTLR
ncbi:MAG: hypothetical protein K5636_03195 [Bacteroidales bacterium]|nr:hypothetical protein [Bacteroidales bacterium]